MDLKALKDVQNMLNQQIYAAGSSVNEALGGYPKVALRELARMAEIPGSDLAIPGSGAGGIALKDFPTKTIRGAYQELVGKLRQLIALKEAGHFGSEELSEVLGLVTQNTPKFVGVRQGSADTVEKLPGMVEYISNVRSRFKHPSKPRIPGSMNREGRLSKYVGSESLDNLSPGMVQLQDRMNNLHEGVHMYQYKPQMGVPYKVNDFEYTGPLAKHLREMGPHEDILPWFMDKYSNLYKGDYIKYLADPGEIMARAVAANLYGRLYNYEGIEGLAPRMFDAYFQSWPQDFNPLFEKSTDLVMKLGGK